MSKFTNSSLIVHTRISPHRNSPRNQPIRKITIHHTAGNIGLEALGDWLARPETRASYNYGISTDGRIGMFVEERDRCWGSSSGANDHQAIVIGVANNSGAPNWGVSDAAYASLIRLCVDICQRNGIVELVYDGTPNGSLTRHNMFSNQVCPGPFLQSRFGEICRLVNNALAPSVTAPPAAIPPMPPPVLIPPPGTPPSEVSSWAVEAWQWAIDTLDMDGTRPRDNITRQEVMTLLHRLYNLLQK